MCMCAYPLRKGGYAYVENGYTYTLNFYKIPCSSRDFSVRRLSVDDIRNVVECGLPHITRILVKTRSYTLGSHFLSLKPTVSRDVLSVEAPLLCKRLHSQNVYQSRSAKAKMFH